MGLVELQERIRTRLQHGGSLDQVEAEIIDPSPFSPEQKAALSLFASATLARARREPRARPLRALRLERG